MIGHSDAMQDSIKGKDLGEVVVEADLQKITPQVATYIPTAKQKSSSQTAVELLNRMSIPQIEVTLNSTDVKTSGGNSVAVYIDYVPATADELKMMRIADVRRVEYYESPSDPRFEGNRHVINFIMARYEYGGYVKALGTESFIANTGSLQANARVSYKRMTYDFMGYGRYNSSNHNYSSEIETFRLPQPDGGHNVFDRCSEPSGSELRQQNYQTSFRALYKSDMITANTLVSAGIDRTPENSIYGSTSYSTGIFTDSEYASKSDESAKNIRFNGYYFFSLPGGNSITANATYHYSHTKQSSLYDEDGMQDIYNAANDNTNKASLAVVFFHDLGIYGNISVRGNGFYEHSRTVYSGTANAIDRSETKFGQLGISYSLSKAGFYGSASFGWNWLGTELNASKASSDYPYADLSAQYSINKKNSVNAVFHYSVWPPSSNYKSGNMIQVAPFMWHTGNPELDASRSYDVGAQYVCIPSNKWNFTLFCNAWIVRNRSAFVYEATDSYIIRTICQPVGNYAQGQYGVYGSVKLMDRKLQLSGRIGQLLVHDGYPFNRDRSYISYYIQAFYYFGSFNFALSYVSEKASSDGSMDGVWIKNKDSYFAQVGWANDLWNIRLAVQNIGRWNWRDSKSCMDSRYYGMESWVSSNSSHAKIILSATYTFGFGKEVSRKDEIRLQHGAASGILK